MEETKTRKDKWFSIGSLSIHYIHYYPTSWSTSNWGWMASRLYRDITIDLYFGRHTIVFVFTRIW